MATEKFKTVQTLLAEMMASFVFGFSVYSALLGSSLTEQTAGSVIVGLTVGFAGVGVIYSFCDMTVAHFNPAITLSAILTGRMNLVRGIGYIIAQYIGFILAVIALIPCSPKSYMETLDTIRATPAPLGESGLTIFFSEFFFTAILVHIAFAVGVNPYIPKVTTEEGNAPDTGDADSVDRRVTAPLCIGLTLGFLAFLGLASSGGVFNPGLAFAPMLLSNTWANFLIYMIAQYSGGLIGALLQVFVLHKLG